MEDLPAKRAVFFESLAAKHNRPVSELFRLAMTYLVLDDLLRFANPWDELPRTDIRFLGLGITDEDLTRRWSNIKKSSTNFTERKAARDIWTAELVSQLESLTINKSELYNYDSFVTETEKVFLMQADFVEWTHTVAPSVSAPAQVILPSVTNNNNISTPNSAVTIPPVSASTPSVIDDLRNFDLSAFDEEAVFFNNLAAAYRREAHELFRLIMANLLLEDLNQLANNNNCQNMPWFSLVASTKRLEKLEGGTTGAKVLTQLREINKHTTDKTERRNACIPLAAELVSEFSKLLETQSKFYTYDDFVTAAEQKGIRDNFPRWTHPLAPVVSNVSNNNTAAVKVSTDVLHSPVLAPDDRLAYLKQVLLEGGLQISKLFNYADELDQRLSVLLNDSNTRVDLTEYYPIFLALAENYLQKIPEEKLQDPKTAEQKLIHCLTLIPPDSVFYSLAEDTIAQIYLLKVKRILPQKKLPEGLICTSSIIAFVKNYIKDNKLPGILFFVPEPEIKQLRELKKEMKELRRPSAPPAAEILSTAQLTMELTASAPPLSPPQIRHTPGVAIIAGNSTVNGSAPVFTPPVALVPVFVPPTSAPSNSAGNQ